ncbi:MAG: hypothetical protein FWF30_02645 [Coriobacteriia bacterium]|nr:hypothetical protein [Coriobacteriia bacterium]
MADEPKTGEQTPGPEGNKDGFSPIVTQEQYEQVAARIRREAQAPYADYQAIKEKAEKYDEQQAAGQTDLDKANTRADKAEKELAGLKAAAQAEAWKQAVSAETGVPAGLLKGTTEQEIKDHAEEIAKAYAPPAAPVIKKQGAGNAAGNAFGDESLARLVFGNN